MPTLFLLSLAPLANDGFGCVAFLPWPCVCALPSLLRGCGSKSQPTSLPDCMSHSDPYRHRGCIFHIFHAFLDGHPLARPTP